MVPTAWKTEYGIYSEESAVGRHLGTREVRSSAAQHTELTAFKTTIQPILYIRATASGLGTPKRIQEHLGKQSSVSPRDF